MSLGVIGDNHAPTGISISSQVTREDLVVGGAVGTLSTTDLNGWDSFTYTFAAGAGDEDNASFEIVGDEVRSLEAFDFETQSQYSVRVRSTDAAGAWVEEELSIVLTDVNEPLTAVRWRTQLTRSLRMRIQRLEYKHKMVFVSPQL